ncbi:MAG TPA: alpha/beta hydrolase [Thermomicrobiales bacterium]|nr:alpha/beta hydrolase [Thermomicrobiales bacterium]
MATIEIRGGRTVHYDATGDGPPLLLIGGLGSTRKAWQPVVEALAPHYRVLRMDNRDAGENDPEDAAYSIEDMAGDVAGFLDALGITRAPVLGHSMGGFIALHLALTRPDLVEKLVLVGTSSAAGAALGAPLALSTEEDWIADPVERALARAPMTHSPGFFDDKPDLLRAAAERTRGNRITREGYNRQLSAISDTHDVRSRLGEITVPALVLHGDVDPLIPIRGGEVLERDLPNARLSVYSGVGHHPQAEMPEKFISEVLEFLRGGT